MQSIDDARDERAGHGGGAAVKSAHAAVLAAAAAEAFMFPRTAGSSLSGRTVARPQRRAVPEFGGQRDRPRLHVMNNLVLDRLRSGWCRQPFRDPFRVEIRSNTVQQSGVHNARPNLWRAWDSA